MENLVKLMQRKFMTPVTEVSSLGELNAPLIAKCERKLNRNAHQVRIAEMRGESYRLKANLGKGKDRDKVN